MDLCFSQSIEDQSEHFAVAIAPAGRVDRGAAAKALPRSVRAAMQGVLEDHARAWTAETLARLAGVTAPTLRKNFKAGLGLTVTEFVRGVRLDWAHARLCSGRELRPIGDLAIAAGFANGSIFARAYVRRFGENPSVVRGSAVRRMR